jgi:DNA-binding response OmpR family regulator
MSDKNKKKVLIVDDDENLRLVLKDKFSLEGFEVFEAQNGKEGLERALAMRPDVILLDVMMPVMNGLDMLKRLRMDAWGKNVEVIMLTVLENAEAVAEAVTDGSFTYFTKTDHNTEDIVNKVKEVIKK